MVAELAEKNDLFVISDEIYEKLAYGAEFISIASLGPEILNRTVTVNGFAKAYPMTTWRRGYAAASLQIADPMSRFQIHAPSGASWTRHRAGPPAGKAGQQPADALR